MFLRSRHPFGRWAAATLTAVALCACGGSSGKAGSTASGPAAAHPGARPPGTPPGPSQRARQVSYDGPTLQHPAPAPPLRLRDYLGHKVDLSAERGHAVLLTFIYTHCPDVCPLIVSTLHNALGLLGPRARQVRIIAVSTDPRGDTHSAVASFLARREMTGRMEYLVGTRSELVPVWKAWGISASNPTGADRVSHSALVYGITGSGRVTVVYPSNFSPKDIAHDVPLLAAN